MEDKKSFLLYSDLIHTVRKMPKDKAGELFLTILSYVNDENPEIEDIMIDLVFEPIKQQLKRDLSKWENKSKTRSAAGRLGGLKSAEAKRIQVKQSQAKPSKTKQSQHVSENVSVSVNVNDNVNVIEDIPPNPLKGEIDSPKKNDSVEPEKKRRQSTPRPKFDPDYSGMEPEAEQALREFNDFRRSKRKAWGSQLEFEKFVEKLRKLSNGSFNTAKEILTESIANGWTGIFELKNNKPNGKAKQSNEDHARTVVNIAANAIAGAEKSKLEREERERRQRESGQKY